MTIAPEINGGRVSVIFNELTLFDTNRGEREVVGRGGDEG